MADQNSSSLRIWLLMQAVAKDFHKVDSNSIFSPQSAFKQADLQAMC